MKDRATYYFSIGIILLAVACILYAPFFLVKNFQEFKETGQIGDTIAGTTAPIIGVLSALLLFVSFYQQRRANNLLEKQLHNDKMIQYVNQWGQHIQSQLDVFKIVVGTEQMLKGGDALRFLGENWYEHSEASFSFFQNCIKNGIPQNISYLCENVVGLSKYVRENDLIRDSFWSHQLYNWMRLVCNLTDQVDSILSKGVIGIERNRWGESVTPTNIIFDTDLEQQNFLVMKTDLHQLNDEARKYLNALGREF